METIFPNQFKPKRITLDLSGCGTFYHAKFYCDVYDSNNGETYESIIEFETEIPHFGGVFYGRGTYEDAKKELFTIEIPDDIANSNKE